MRTKSHDTIDLDAVKVLDHLVQRAVSIKASDIHLEPRRKALNVRFRIDGVMSDQGTLPLDLAPSFAAAVAASPRHRSAGFMPTPEEAGAGTEAMTSDHRPSTYGEQLWNYFNRSYADAMRHHHGAVLDN